jgi:hypothetical protein
VAGALAKIMYGRWLKDPSSVEFPALCAASVGFTGVFLFRAFSALLSGKAKQ